MAAVQYLLQFLEESAILDMEGAKQMSDDYILLELLNQGRENSK